VKDLALDIEIRLQYDHGCTSLPVASRTLLSKPLLGTLGLPHNEKHQWLISINATHQPPMPASSKGQDCNSTATPYGTTL